MNKRVGLCKGLIILLSLSLYHSADAQNNGGYVLLSGEIVSAAGTPIEGVHILNTSNNELAISDENGFFTVSIHKSHVLRFSAVSFRTYYFTLKEKDKDQMLYKRITLQTITVGLKNVDIVAKEEPRAENLFRPKPLPPPFTFGYQGEQHEVKPTLANPVSLLYNWLSKEGKQKRKLEELLKQDEIKKLVAQQFNSDLIWELTGYTGDELERFKQYCNLSDYFIANASDYELLLRIKQCYNTYEPNSE